LYEPRTSSSQTNTAAIGTEMYLGTCASPSAAPIPTNSLMQMPRFATSTESVANADQRTPYCSRINSARPFPVTAPIRAAISWTTIRLTVITTIIHSRS
jgi:hypothetical protein